MNALALGQPDSSEWFLVYAGLALFWVGVIVLVMWLVKRR